MLLACLGDGDPSGRHAISLSYLSAEAALSSVAACLCMCIPHVAGVASTGLAVFALFWAAYSGFEFDSSGITVTQSAWWAVYVSSILGSVLHGAVLITTSR